MAYTTLRELYERSIERYADRPCNCMYAGECLTYGEFAVRVDTVVQMLRDAGLRSGDKIALLSNNMPNWAVCYFAVVTSGLVIVPILPDFSAEELDMIIAHSEAKALFVSDKLFGKVGKKTVSALNLVVRTPNLGIIQQKKDVNASTEDFGAPSPADLAVIIYTSGTMSRPKGVMLTHWNLASQIRMDYDLFPIEEEDVFLSILPLAHTYECSLGMLLPFSSGAQVVYLDKLPTASTLMPALLNVRPTVMLSVPLVIEKIYKSQVAARFRKRRLLDRLYSTGWFRRAYHRLAGRRLRRVFGGNLRFFGIGGAKLDAATELFLHEARFPYAIGYGLTETAPLLAGAIPGRVKLRSTGPMLRDVLVRLDNVDPETGDGEIVVHSPSTMQGYFKNPEATRSVLLHDGWFRTKDLGHFDEEGNLFIMGRVDNMIVGADGENIYPEEIESVINSHLLVTDSIVKKQQGKLVAMVHFDKGKVDDRPKVPKQTITQRMTEIKNELIEYVNSKVNKSSRISEVEEQEKGFEKTPTQKIKRFKYTASPAKKQKAGAATQESGLDTPKKSK